MRKALIRILFSGAVVALAAAGFAGSAAAKIVVVEKVGYYNVKGLSGMALARSMLVGGQKTIALHDAIAATTSEFDFVDPELAIENGRCVVKDITVKLSLEYQFPRWTGRGAASRVLRQRWDAFYAELVRHEKTHGKIAREFAAKIEREMRRMSGTVVLGCNDFGLFTNVKLKMLSSQLKRLQDDFDRREDRSTSRISKLQNALLKTP